MTPSNHEDVQALRSVDAFRRVALPLAEQRWSPQHVASLFDRGGSETGSTDRRNREVLDRTRFQQRIIHNVTPATDATFLGYELATPIMIAPMATMAALMEDGVGQMCTAARDAGSMTWTASNRPDVYERHAGVSPLVDIEKPFADRDRLLQRLQMAERAGCFAVGVDVDSSGGHKRGDQFRERPWKPLDAEELRAIKTALAKPFIVKGVLSVDDAVAAADAGVDAIVLSNHYGVALDYAQSPLEVLPSIVDAVGTRVEVLVDCQMRRGTDVLKALALGARSVLVGRPILWAALVGGADGMAHLLRLMTAELKRAMLYTGVARPRDATPDILVLPRDVFGALPT
jgi:isopentenyl diphosphate isomerase/L-lactate dehydrogenase-like FMN-dependent dehydrogenase